MKRLTKVLIGLLLSFCCTFMCVGYAAITGSLTVNGTLTYEPPEGIYITDVTVNTTSNASSSTYAPITYSTSVNAALKKTSSSGYWGSSGSVTYNITVWNNTPYVYAYSGLEYSTSTVGGYNGNGIIGSGNNRIQITPSINTSTTIAPGQRLIFTSTYTLGRSLNTTTTYNTLVNYKFGVNIDSVGDYAIHAVIDQFSDILNDTEGDYLKLADAIDNKFDGRNGWTSNYIGNVADSDSADSTVVNDLFEGKLHIMVDGKQTNVTLLIKREDVDGNENTGDSYTAVNSSNGGRYSASGCEMTIYLTTDPLDGSDSTPPIYAVVFTCDASDGTYDNWYMLGDMYEGTATIVGYEGGASTGSFDTGTWKSTYATYEVVDGYSYNIGNRNTIQTITQATDTSANNKLLSLLNEAKTILDANQYAGSAMVNLQTAFAKASYTYTVSDNGTISLKSGLTRAEAVPMIKEIDHALKAFNGLS